MSLTLTIGGVDKTSTFYLPGSTGDVTFSFIPGTRGSLRLKVYDVLGAAGYRPAIDDTLTLADGATTVFSGRIDDVDEQPLTDLDTGVVTALTASDWSAVCGQVSYNVTYAAGSTLKAALTDLVTNKLSAFGITLDAAQATGPTFSTAVTFSTNVTVNEILNRFTALTGWLWRITPTKTLLMIAPAATSCGYSLSDADTDGVLGVVSYRQSRALNYANTIVLTCGTAKQVLKDEPFTGDGVASSWTLTYAAVTDAGGFIVSRGYVTEAGVNKTVGVYGDTSVSYQWRASNNTLYRTAGPLGAGVAISFGHQVQLPFTVTYANSAEVTAHGTYEGHYDAPDIEDYTEGVTMATALARQTITQPKIVTVKTTKGIAYPGQSIALTFAERNLSGTFMITGVDVSSAEDGSLEYTLTCVSGAELATSWLDFYKETSTGTGSGAGGTVSGGATVTSGVAGSGTAGKLAKWATSSSLTDSIVSESGTTATVAGTLAATTFSGSGASLTSVPAGQLTGTIPAATLAGRSLADLGTRSAGDLSSGNLAYARMPSGAGTWSADPTISGTLTVSTISASGDLALSPAGVIAAKSIIPALTDTYDLGRYDRLWNQSYISQMNALVFAKTTQTLFGGYSSIGKNAGSFAADVASAATTIDFGQAMTVGDFVLVRAHDTGGTIKAEYLQVGTLVSGTTYNVTRDLAAAHVTDPAWASGTPYLVLGTTNDGRIDLFAYDGKPRIVFTQQGATYNAQSDRGIIGNLNSYFGYATDVYGAAFGDAAAANITIDPTNGFRVRQGTTTYAQLASSVFTVGNPSGKRIGWDGTNLTLVSDYVTLDNTGIALAPDTTGLFVTTNSYRWSVSHGWMGIGGSDTAGGNRVITIDAFNDTYTAGRDSYVQLLARTKNSSSNQVQAGIVLRAPASGTATVAVDSALVQATGAYIYPGSASGLSANQTTYYLASHASWGLYTNTGMYTAGAFTAASGFNVDTNGAAYTVKNAAGTGYLSALTVDSGNLTTIFCNSARLRFVTPSIGASCSGASLGALNVLVDGVGNVRIPYY